jgi:gamma-glutamyltranspeptidase
MLVRAANGSYEAFNFREKAPAAAFTDMFNDNHDLSQVGGLSIGVPGEIRGFEAAHKKYGTLPWSRLFEPAINVSLNGWIANAALEAKVKVTCLVASIHN